MSMQQIQEFWDRMPCNSKHSSQPFLSKEYFAEIEKKRYFVEPHIPGFAGFSDWKGKRVLELGCGIGTDSIQFARQGAHVTLVDVSPKSLEICRARFALEGLSATMLHGNIEELEAVLPAADTLPFDLIYSFGVIHHTQHPERVIAQLSRYMHAHSELRIMLYSKVSFKMFWLMMEQGVKDMSDVTDLVRRNSEKQYGCPYTWLYTLEEARQLLEAHGLQVTHIEKKHIFRWSIPEYCRNEYVLDAYWKDVPEEHVRAWEKELGWHTLITAKRASN